MDELFAELDQHGTPATLLGYLNFSDGRPDPRPTVRETVPILGDLKRDFDFNRAPRAPVLLPVHPKTTLVAPLAVFKH